MSMTRNTLDLASLIKSIRQQKQKYHAKVLSQDAIYVGWLRTLDLEDLFSEDLWQIVLQFNLGAIGISINFDFPPIDVQPIDISFDVELPTVEEFLQGILLVITIHDLLKDYPWLGSLEDYITTNIEEPYSLEMLKSMCKKGYYGYSRYLRAYYDPVLVRDFLRSFLIRLWAGRETLLTLKRDYEILADILGINKWVIRSIFDRLSLFNKAQYDTFILGYGVLGLSRLGKPLGDPVPAPSEVIFRNYDLQYTRAGITTLDHVQFGFILGMTPLGYGFLCPPRSIYKKPPVKLPSPYPEFAVHKGSPPVREFVERKVLRTLFQFRYLPLAFANYNTSEEQMDYHKSERTDQWASLQMLRYAIEKLVDPVIRQYESNPVKIRAYKSAALHLINLKAKRHVWGFEAFYKMSENQLKEYWIRHWVQQGLKPEVLEAIYERVKLWLKPLRIEKLKLGLRVKQSRFSLARLLS